MRNYVWSVGKIHSLIAINNEEIERELGPIVSLGAGGQEPDKNIEKDIKCPF